MYKSTYSQKGQSERSHFKIKSNKSIYWSKYLLCKNIINFHYQFYLFAFTTLKIIEKFKRLPVTLIMQILLNHSVSGQIF